MVNPSPCLTSNAQPSNPLFPVCVSLYRARAPAGLARRTQKFPTSRTFVLAYFVMCRFFSHDAMTTRRRIVWDPPIELGKQSLDSISTHSSCLKLPPPCVGALILNKVKHAPPSLVPFFVIGTRQSTPHIPTLKPASR